jgi:hypothetical protein
MKLEEIEQGNAADQRVKRLKDNAKAAKEKAQDLKAQADTSAEQLKIQKSRQTLTQRQRSPAISTIKPYH